MNVQFGRFDLLVHKLSVARQPILPHCPGNDLYLYRSMTFRQCGSHLQSEATIESMRPNAAAPFSSQGPGPLHYR